jgi:hypothetical protein
VVLSKTEQEELLQERVPSLACMVVHYYDVVITVVFPKEGQVTRNASFLNFLLGSKATYSCCRLSITLQT